MSRFLKRFSSKDLLTIAIFAALGIAIKPIVTPLVHLISTPLMIPGGSLAGGLYMMWLALTINIVWKPGTGMLFGLVQGVTVLALGLFGSHGVVSLISYTLPGVIGDLVMLLLPRKQTAFHHAMLCSVPNIVGSLVVTILIMRMPGLMIAIALTSAAVSGIIGGTLSWIIYQRLVHFRVIVNESSSC